ncbi:hypothetical protein SMICM304S_10806 [Streptomyces microflavus]
MVPQAQFHPRKYLLALADDITAQGGLIYERVRVTGLSEGSPCKVTTEGAVTITAEDVIVATHFPVFDRALHFARLSPRRELVVAAPIAVGRAPKHMCVTDDMGKRSVRTAPLDGGRRLLVVTGESFTPGAGDSHQRFLRLDRWVHDHFPVGETAYRWAAQDNDVSDGVPLVGLFHPGARHVYVATGFGGWGMSGGAMAGQLLAALVTGAQPEWAGLYDPRRLWSTLREAPALLKQQVEVVRHFVGDRAKTTHVDSVAEIAPGSGAVVRIRGAPLRRLSRGGRNCPCCVGALYPSRLPGLLQRGRNGMGVPLPWIAVRHRRQGAPRPRPAAVVSPESLITVKAGHSSALEATATGRQGSCLSSARRAVQSVGADIACGDTNGSHGGIGGVGSERSCSTPVRR